MIMILCRTCKIEKPLDDFHRDKNKKHGRHNICKKCRKQYDKKYQQLNKEKIKKNQKKYRVSNKVALKEYKKEYYKVNKQQVMKKVKAYRKSNLGIIRAKDALKRAKKLNRIPKWLNDEHIKQIEIIFIEAVKKEKETGIRYSVDHIIPLNGDGVVGLHVPWNLQIMTLSENSSKRNKV